MVLTKQQQNRIWRKIAIAEWSLPFTLTVIINKKLLWKRKLPSVFCQHLHQHPGDKSKIVELQSGTEQNYLYILIFTSGNNMYNGVLTFEPPWGMGIDSKCMVVAWKIKGTCKFLLPFLDREQKNCFTFKFKGLKNQNSTVQI